MNIFDSQICTRYVFAIVVLVTIMVMMMSYMKYLEYQNARAMLYINTIVAESSPNKIMCLNNESAKKEDFVFAYKIKPKKFIQELTDVDLMNLQ